VGGVRNAILLTQQGTNDSCANLHEKAIFSLIAALLSRIGASAMMDGMKTSAVFFPFDLFGSSGTSAGVALLADELREVLSDNKRESAITRARAYTDHVRLREVVFENLDDYSSWRKQGRQLVRSALRQKDFLVWVSGNHLGALPVYDELSALGESVLVVQFDAHLDIHQFRDCTEELSHGNFLLHCDGPLPPLINAGHRDLLLPADQIGKHFRHTFSAMDVAVNPASVESRLRELSSEPERIFIDLDCDVFDPVYFSAVTQPVPFGLAPPVLLALIESVWSPKVAGLCISEFDPGRDHNDRSLATVVWLIEYLLLRRYE
jgi:arginase family enzyme